MEKLSRFCGWLLVFSLICLSGSALAQDIKVGDTKDACDASNRVRLHGKAGDVFIKAGDSQRVELPALTNEIFWFCGGDRNRSANGEHFNVVKISRKDNGAITCGFFRTAPPAPAPNLVRVGTTKDGCDGSRQVKFQGKDGDVSIKAGQSKLVELSSARNTLNWDCVPPSGNCPSGDVCDEHVGNSIAFDTVQIERAGNGAISWVFYMKKNSAPSSESATPDYVRNATGNLRVGVSAGSLKKELPGIPTGLLKTAARNAWLELRDTHRAEIKEEITTQGKAAAGNLPGGSFVLESLTLAGAEGVELRTAAEGNSLWLKLLAHGNVAQTKFVLSGLPDPVLKLTFDIEVELRIKPESLMKTPKAETAVMRLGHFEIEGANVAGNIAQEVFKSKLRNAKTQANAISKVVLDEINQQLGKFFPTAPKDFPLSVVKADISVTRAGSVMFCLHTPGAPACQFSGPEEVAHSPRVLDDDVDRCGSSLIWLRDSQKRRFIGIGKGKQNVLVEVESREFPWFCGGDSGPESAESAAGPVGTYLLRVSRAATGDRIDWKFLSWH
jgi:hypothetical protein